MMRVGLAVVAAALLVWGCVEDQARYGGPVASGPVASGYGGTTYADPAYSNPGYANPGYARPASQQFAQRDGRRDELRIHDADYGERGRYCNAERTLSRECEGRRSCDFRVNNQLCGDPIRDVVKEVRVTFSCGRDRERVTAREGQRVELRCSREQGAVASVTGRPDRPDGGRRGDRPGGRDNIQVLQAVYGAPGGECNATRAIASRCGDRECQVRADNSLCGDPAFGAPKTLVVTYTCRGVQRQAVAREGQTARIGC